MAPIDDRRIVCIGGAATSGKTTLARGIAERLSLPWISTDQIRLVMRVTGDPARQPDLFRFQDYVERRLRGDDIAPLPADVVEQLQFEESCAVWAGVEAFVRRDYKYAGGFVLEGVGLLPHRLAELRQDFAAMRAVILEDPDRERARAVIQQRHGGRCTPEAIEDQVDWIVACARRYRRDAEQHGLPVVGVAKTAADVDAVLALIDC